VSEIIDTLVDGLLDRESDTGSIMTWFGQALPCSGGASKEGKMLDIGGFKPNAAVVLVLRISLLAGGATTPLAKHSLTYTSEPGATPRKLLIDTVTTLYNELLVLECNDPSQGA
jgi:hypothetical protein